MTRNARHTMSRKKFVTVSAAGVVGMGIAGGTHEAKAAVTEAGTGRIRTLGNTGLNVTAVGFGASRTDDPSVMKQVFETGVNFLDTGRMYANGRNEQLVGRVIRDIRKDLVIQSKFSRKLLTDGDQIMRSMEASLKALRTDYIDIMLKQNASKKDELLAPAVLESLAKAKEQGKIRFAGFSAHNNQAEMLREAVECEAYDVAMISYNHAGNYTHSVSNNYYEWDQAELEREIERAAQSGMGIVAMKTCSGGPYDVGNGKPSYTAALKKVLENRYVATMVPAMASFAQIREDTAAMPSA